MKFVIRVDEGMMIPAWYGVAWREMVKYETICMPVPLNIIAAVGRGIYHWLRYGYKIVAISPRDAYAQGIKEGKKK